MSKRLAIAAMAALALAGCDRGNVTEPTLEANFARAPSDRGTANLERGAVFTTSNAAGGNQVVVFSRAADGTLSPAGSFATGGSGSGLGSQGALALNGNGKLLFVVNAGSNTVSSLAVERGGLRVVDQVSSGGMRPVSLTVSKDLLYVLNAGKGGNITGLTVGRGGELSPLGSSTRPLSGAPVTGPAEVSFNPAGDLLVVTEKESSRIDTYTVGPDGRPSLPSVHPSAGKRALMMADDVPTVAISPTPRAPSGSSTVSGSPTKCASMSGASRLVST